MINKKIRYFILPLIAGLFISTASFAQENLQKIRINDFSGGMNSNYLADIISPNQGASMVNITLNRKGRLEKRGGQALFADDVGSTSHTGIGRFDPDANTSYMMIASGTNIARATASVSSWVIINASDQLTSDKDTEFVQANNLLFILNGHDSTSWHDGSRWTTASTYPTSPPTAKVGAWIANYLFLAGNPDHRDWVYFSNNLEPEIFDANDVFKVNTGDGQVIQNIQPFREHELIIYKERSIFVYDISDTTLQPITISIGTIAPRSVVSLGNDQWFLSSEPIAVRSLVRTSFDKILTEEMSDAIQDIFDGSGYLTINKTYINKAAAVLFDDKYILAIATGVSTVNNTVVVYDFRAKAWYLIEGWYPVAWKVFDNRLFYIDAYDGRVVECFVAQFADFNKGPEVNTEPTQPINFTYISRIHDFDNPENYKEADALEVEFDPTGDYTATIFINLDNNGWQNVGSINLAGNSLTLPITLPSQLRNSGVSRQTFHLSQYGEFKKIQIMVQQQGKDQDCILQRATIFGRIKPWRRE